MNIERNYFIRMTITEFAEQHDLTMLITERSDPKPGERYYARFKNVEYPCDLHDTCRIGNGDTEDEAIADYGAKISKKTIWTTTNKKIKVPELTHPCPPPSTRVVMDPADVLLEYEGDHRLMVRVEGNYAYGSIEGKREVTFDILAFAAENRMPAPMDRPGPEAIASATTACMTILHDLAKARDVMVEAGGSPEPAAAPDAYVETVNGHHLTVTYKDGMVWGEIDAKDACKFSVKAIATKRRIVEIGIDRWVSPQDIVAAREQCLKWMRDAVQYAARLASDIDGAQYHEVGAGPETKSP